MNKIDGTARTTDTHVYFWNGIYSQWSKSDFMENGVNYPNAEFYIFI